MEIRREELERTCERLGVRLLVLFGSHSAGGLPPGPGSDVDLALSFRRDATRVPVLDLHEQLTAAFPDGQLDIVLLHHADPLFRWEILERATLLYGDVNEFLLAPPRPAHPHPLSVRDTGSPNVRVGRGRVRRCGRGGGARPRPRSIFEGGLSGRSA